MADQRITELTAYNPPIDTDVLPVVDVTSSATKKVTWANIKAAIRTYLLGTVNSWSAIQTFVTPVINGLATGSGVASAATVSTIVLRDASGNTNIVNLIEGYRTTATAGGTTTLTVADTYQQYFTGTLAQTVTLPVTSTLALGFQYMIVNNSTGLVTINSSGGNAIVILAAGTSATLTCILTSGTTAASWNYGYLGLVVATGKKLTVNQSITFTGTDGITYTLPTTNATLARTDAGQTFTGQNTFSKPAINGTDPTGATYAPSSGAQTVALDCAANNIHVVTGHASGTAITFTVANATNDQIFMVSILQGAVVSTITGWFATVRWPAGTTPTLTATVGKRDTFIFKRTGANTYDGFVVGQAC